VGSDNNPEIPLDSIEDQEGPQYSPDLPRFDISGTQDSQHSLPPHIPSHLQNEASLSTQDYISSTASSPSAAYASLSIECDRSADLSGSEGGVLASNTDTRERRSHSPNRSFAHRVIMGGADNFPQRSSSPLKRPASDLEQEPSNAPEHDVDMDRSPTADSSDPSHTTVSSMTQVEQSTGPRTSTSDVSGQMDKEGVQPNSDPETLKDRTSHCSI
jgi:ubiquitin carboxyl-terminal hydrolase 4/11/15